MLAANQSANSKLFISGNLGMAIGINKVFDKLVVIEEPIVVEEPRFILVTKGSCSITVNLIDYDLHPGTIVYIGSGSIVQMRGLTARRDYDGIGFMMSEDTLRIVLHDKMPQSLNGTERSFFVETTEDERHVFLSIAKALWAAIHQEGDHQETVNALLAAIIHTVDDNRNKSICKARTNRSRERDIFDRFISLVNKHSAQEHKLPFYADKLCISDKYLSTIVKQTSGISTKDWIDRSITTSAKVMLYHSDMQIAQIADRLNFPNASFFCKYFKRNTGISPMQYRGKLQNEVYPSKPKIKRG